MNGSFDVTTVVFAILAIFVVWKLRSVLGTRTGNERPPFDPFARRNGTEPPVAGRGQAGKGETGKVIPLPGAADRAAGPGRAETTAGARWKGVAEPGSRNAAGLDAIAAADPNFEIAPFMTGARAAYEAIITAYASGDKATLKPLLAPEVFDGFSAAIDRREAKGETVETTVVSFDTATVEDAQLRGGTAQVAIRFLSKLITVTRDRAGGVIDGDPEKVADIVDLWTFARATDSRDPNWQLVATETGP